MKTLYLVRHAKSSWKHPELSDFERPLNKRGKNDAPFMGKLLFKKGIKAAEFLALHCVNQFMNDCITIIRKIRMDKDSMP